MFLLYYLFCMHLASAYRLLPEIEEHGGMVVATSHRMAEVDITQVPFHVLVFYPKLFCSGILIGSKIVLTIASCFENEDVKVSVKVGTSSVTDPGGQIIPVVKLKLHEFFKYRSGLDNDIAMLVLERHVQFSNAVEKIALVPPDVALRVGTDVEVSGFGGEAHVLMADLHWSSKNMPVEEPILRLIGTTMVILETIECVENFGDLFTSSMYCVQFGPESLIKDNGGPGVFERTLLVGIASYEANRKEPPFIAVFTNVSYFNRWIDLNTRKLLQLYCEERDEAKSYSDDYDRISEAD